MQIEGEEGEDPVLAFRRTLGMFATGVTVITTTPAEQVHGMTANAFMSVSLRPPLVLISVDNRAKMHAMLNEGKRIGISVLSETQEALSDRFAGRPGGPGPSRASTWSARRRSCRARSRTWSRGSRDRTGVAITRCSSGTWSTPTTGTGSPLLFHGGHYEALSAPEGSILGALPPAMREKLLVGRRGARVRCQGTR